MSDAITGETRDFVEGFGNFFESQGMPRMAGRIWGWLMICTPPQQSAAEIADVLQASRGSVSTMTKMLMQFGLLERFGVPGDRNRFYRIKKGSFFQLLKSKMAVSVEVRKMADRGLDILQAESPSVRDRLQECRDFYAFFEKEFPALIARWEEEGKNG